MKKRLLSFLLVLTMIVGIFPTMPSFDVFAADDGLVLWYKFDDGAGTIVTDSSGNGYDGTINGGAVWTSEDAISFDGSTGYVDIPDGIMAGLTDITISTKVYMDEGNANPSWVYTFGSAEDPGSAVGTTYLGLLQDGSGNFRATISDNRWSNEQRISKESSLTKGVWKHIIFTLSGTIGILYEDGVEVARNENVTIDPQNMENPTTIANYIGKPAYPGDNYFKGQVSDFRIYNIALSATEAQANWIKSLNDDDAVQGVKNILSLGDTSAIIANMNLQTSLGDVNISWASDNEAIIANDGTVTRPADADATVALTAEISRGIVSDTKTFTVTVKKQGTLISLDAEHYNLSVGSIHLTKITATYPDTSTADVTKDATFASSDSLIAEVDAAGAVKGISQGSATITATYEGKEYNIEVTVIEDMLLGYDFSEGTGTTVTDISGNGRNGTLNGGVTWLNGNGIELNGEDAYVQIPNGVLKDLQEITIVIDMLVNSGNVNPSWIYTFGNSTDPYGTENSTYLGLFHHSNGGLRGTISNNRWSNEQNVIKSGGLTRGIWKQMAYTLSGTTATLYEDGVEIAKNVNISLAPKDMEVTIANYIGKPAYLQDNYFKGKIKGFKLYNRAWSAQEVESENESTKGDDIAVEQDYQDLTLGDTSAVQADLVLPSLGEYGSSITWTSADTNYITDNGKVTRPANGEGNKIVTLTATVTKGSYQKIKEFQITLIQQVSDTEKIQDALDSINIPNKDEVRGNITLPEIANGLSVVWTASPSGIISTDTIPASENNDYAPIPAGVVTRQSADTKVVLTASIKLNGTTETKEIEVTVKAIPEAVSESDYTAYLFAYFAGQSTADGEQIYFGVSKDGLFFNDLNNNEPVLTSEVGEKGVRDPYILRSPEGDKFYLIATDLSIFRNGDWGRAQTSGSRSIVVWESTDLVNWTDERLVKVARDDAGCTWAPEIVYDDLTGEYNVFWASRVAEDGYAKQRIYIAKTRDFYTFTEPEVYIDRTQDVIDTTIIKHDGKYYRFSKDENKKNILMDVGSQLFGEFTSVSAPVVEAQGGVEGPAIYKLNGQDKWVLLLDNYGGSGYYPLVSEDLASGVFTKLSTSAYKMPTGPRHGTVMPVTQAEYDALMAQEITRELSKVIANYTGLDATKYTTDSFAKFELAYNNATVVAAKTDATKTEVNDAIEALEAAFASLVKVSVPVEDAEGLILHYEFNDDIATGVVKDSSGSGYDGILKGTGALLSDGILTLPGGSSGAYVELPTGMFDNQNTLTITTWLQNKTGGGNYAAMFFGTSEGYPSQYWLFNPCNPSGRFKSVITNKLNTSSPWSTEYGISPTNGSYGIAGPKTDSNWAYYTTVIEPTQITAYYNGVKVGTVATNRTVSQFGEDLVAYIGKSSYSDPYFKGSIKDVKVYTTALTEEQVMTFTTKAILAEEKNALELENTTVVSDISLPAKINNSLISWKSSNASFITDDGHVTRPAEGQGDTNVTLTATLLLNGITETKQFNIVVLEDSQANDAAYLAEIAEAFVLGANYVTDDIALPTSIKDNVAISWKTNNASLISTTGQVSRPQIGAGNKKVNLTAVLQLGQAKIEKVFEVTVLEETYGYLLSYVVSGDTAKTDALHIAYSLDGNTFTALYNNRPIRYASQGSDKMGSPSLFRKIDGTYGLIAADNNSSSYIILFDSEDLLTYTNERLIKIGGSVNVKHPICSFDASVGAYRINFEGSDGKSYTTVTKDFVSFTAIEETSYEKAAVGSETLPTGAIETSVFELTKAEYERVVNKYSRITNTGVKPAQVVIKTGNTLTTPNRVTLTYSDGSTKDMGVVWNADQLNSVDTSKEGTYTVNGTVVQTEYTNPLVEERADPWVILGDDGWYYFTGSYPVRGNSDPEGYDRVILRRSKTIEGLKDAEEITIWHEKDSDTANRYIWAPEIHNIDGKWYVLFTASRSGNVWDIRPHMLACEGDGDPFKPENWVEKGQVKAAPGDTFAFTHFSLDMTYFENNGKHYVAWAEKPGSSDIYLATINPEEPWQLTSAAMLLTTPQYGWEWNGGDVINEGAAVLKHDGKVFVFFSGSSVDRNYCVGYVSADMDADLMDISSWTKNAYPLLTSDDLNGEFGPGHNSFTVDTYGNPVIVYHARPEDCALGQCEFGSSTDLNDPCRHARAKNVHFAVDGSPILNMTYEEELAEEFKTVTMTVKVEKRSSDGGSSDKDNTTGSSTKPTTTVSGSIVNTNVTSKVDNGKATGTLTQSQMNDILAKAQNAANKTGNKSRIEINLDKSEGASTVEATIPGASMKDMASGDIGSLTISGGLGSLTFDAASIGTISGAALADITISMAKVQDSDLPDTVKKIVGNRPVYDFNVTSGGKAISKFGGAVTVSIPYTPSAGEDINAIVVYFINDSGEPEPITNGRYDAETGTMVFTTNHFSTYAVGYNKISFTDVAKNAWYQKAVTFIAAREITSGTGNGKFSPEINLTRGQFITLLLKAYGIEAEKNSVNNFADAGNTYYTGYLAAAKRLGITKGVGNNKFAPNSEITRQEMFTMLYKTLKVIGKLPERNESYSDKTLSGFIDSDNIAAYAKEAIEYLVKTGIVNGSNNKLVPEGSTTRAQMAQVLYNLMMK